MIDTHFHALPGVDDGPADMDEAVAMCRLAAAEGTTTIIATPHQRHERCPNRDGAALVALCTELQRQVGERPRIVPGAEIRVDDTLLAELDAYPAGGLLSLAGSRYLLLEFPFVGGVEPRPLVHELVVAGWQPILAHAERISRWIEQPEELADLVRLGAWVQITAGSVLGRFGRRVRGCAAWLLDRDLVHLAASDAHDTGGRPPELGLGHAALSRGWGTALADRLTITNPTEILAGRSASGTRD